MKLTKEGRAIFSLYFLRFIFKKLQGWVLYNAGSLVAYNATHTLKILVKILEMEHGKKSENFFQKIREKIVRKKGYFSAIDAYKATHPNFFVLFLSIWDGCTKGTYKATYVFFYFF